MTLQLFWVFLNCLNFVQIFVLFMDVFSSPTGSFPAMFDSLHLCNSLVWFFQGGGKPPDRGWGKPPLNFFGIFVEPLKQFQGEDSPEWMPWIALSCRGWLRNNATTSKTSICISNHMIIDPAISGAGNFWAKPVLCFFEAFCFWIRWVDSPTTRCILGSSWYIWWAQKFSGKPHSYKVGQFQIGL